MKKIMQKIKKIIYLICLGLGLEYGFWVLYVAITHSPKAIGILHIQAVMLSWVIACLLMATPLLYVAIIVWLARELYSGRKAKRAKKTFKPSGFVMKG